MDTDFYISAADIGSNLYVAKKFFETGSGVVTTDHNTRLLKQSSFISSRNYGFGTSSGFCEEKEDGHFLR